MITVHHNPAPVKRKPRKRTKAKNPMSGDYGSDMSGGVAMTYNQMRGQLLASDSERAKVARGSGKGKPAKKPKTRAKVQSDILRAEAEKFIEEIESGRPVNTLDESELRLLGNYYGVPSANSVGLKTLITKVSRALGVAVPPTAELVPLSDFKRKKVKRQFQKTRKIVESRCSVIEKTPVKVGTQVLQTLKSNPMPKKKKNPTPARRRKRRNPANPSYQMRSSHRRKRRNPSGSITLDKNAIMETVVEGAMAAGGSIASAFIVKAVGNMIPAVSEGVGKGLAQCVVGIGLGMGVQAVTKNAAYGKAVAIGSFASGITVAAQASGMTLAGLSGLSDGETAEQYFKNFSGLAANDFDPQFGRYIDGHSDTINGVGRYIDGYDGVGYGAPDDDIIGEYQEAYLDEMEAEEEEE